MAAFGAPDALRPNPDDSLFPVYEENARALEYFLSLATQWRMTFGGITGLDYASVDALFKIRGVKQAERSDLFADLQTMERAALPLLNAREGK